MMLKNGVIERLLHSAEPSVRWKIRVHLLGERVSSAAIQQLQQEVKNAPRVQTLLSERDEDGRIPHHPYAKWVGAHWVLADLADNGYPAEDTSLRPLWEQVCEWLFGAEHQKRIRQIDGRVRRCASQEGNALFYSLKLGLADERTEELASRLVAWQWPDGGWNCDKHPTASHSSYHESFIPLRALALHAQTTGNAQSGAAAARAAEIFLKRRLFRRLADGSVIHEDFLRLYYPGYWHYNVLAGLKVLAEAGFIHDERCREALAWLANKQLPEGGFPAEKKYYQVTDREVSGRSLVNWGVTSKRQMNEFVTADALFVLRSAGFT
jgi:hypothetical protein